MVIFMDEDLRVIIDDTKFNIKFDVQEVMQDGLIEKAFHVFIHDDMFYMNETKMLSVKRIIENINNDITEMNKKEVENMSHIAEKINKETYILTKNVIEMLPIDTLLKKNNLIEFYYFMSNKDHLVNVLLKFDPLLIRGWQNNIFEDIYNGLILKYAAVLKKYVETHEENYCFLAWYLIHINMNSVIAEKWINEFGNILKIEKYQSLNDCVFVFCHNKIIPKRNSRIIGLFTLYLMNSGFFAGKNIMDFNNCRTEVLKLIDHIEKDIDLDMFEMKIIQKQQQSPSLSINDVDLMDGYEFEIFLADLFSKMGYTTEVTKASGDQGLDVLVIRSNNKIGIQAKCYSGPVGNKAVQEISAAIKHYNCTKGIVITNSTFTKSAVELAETNRIILWDREMLKKKINEFLV